uniref:Retrotransposon gag domain-containing protein n=1 Tax=Fagus sylvatica TaxID=28930 RepID=A0A2N9FYJ3_FAGSY
MEGAPNDGTSADPAMTPIERQMQGPPTPHDDNQPPPRGGNRSNDQEADSHQVTRRRGGEVERTPPRSRHRAESAGSSAPPSQHKTAKTTRSSKQPERPDRSSKQPEREDRRGNSSRQPDHPDRSTRDPDDKTARLEKELREMRKQMGDMKNSLRAKAARNLDNLVHRADSPFIPSIADFPLPSRFKVPLLENFDGTKDPFDYLEAFKTIMQLQAVPEELSRAFIDHFIGSQRRGRPPTHLLSVKQMEGESLRTFVHRFNEEAMKIDRPKEDVTVTAFMAGLRKGDFLYELCKDPPETMSELMYEATKHMNAEDALEAMDDPPPKRRKEAEDRKPEPSKQKVPKFTETPERKRTTAPPVKFSSFTPLNTPIDKLLLQIQEDPSLRWPGKIRSDPNSRPKNLYCRFHRDHGHLTEECVALKEQIETLIRQGKLQKYVSRPTNTRPAKPPAQREQAEHNRPGPVGEIRTIVGGPASGGTSRASRKAYARQVHNIMVVQRPPKNIRLDDQIISFSEEDARGTHQPHDDALVITINIAGFTTRRVMVDNGSSADILYLPAYQQMRLDKDKLRPMDAPLVGFTGDKVCPVGIVTLPITVGTHPKTVSKTVDFLVVNCPSAYNAIIGRPTLNRLRAVTSTYHLLLKFPTEHGIGEVRGDQIAARECYLASLGSGGQNQTMSIEEQKTLVKPSGELDTIELEDGRPERTTKVGADLPPEMKESLVQFLKDNKDVFAWSHEDMPGINPSIISHKLNVDPSLRPIKQKRRVFAPERNNAIMEEVDKLLAANFIREVYYPDWLANVVMVKKSTGKWRMCVDFTDLNKACPKDSFPLPRIDQLVDSTAGHKLLTFMDAFSGYNQIVMDEERPREDLFHHQQGAFLLQSNAFRTEERRSHLPTTDEQNVPRPDWPERRSLRRRHRGIEANPDKIKAILEMQATKEHQRSTKTDGKIACTESVHVSIHRQVPTILQNTKEGPVQARRGALPVPGCFTNCRQLRTNPGRRKTTVARLLHEQSAERSRGKISSYGKLDGLHPVVYSSSASSTSTTRPRTAIKAQALADFIAEFTSKDDEPTEDVEQTSKWTMNIDGIVDKRTQDSKQPKYWEPTELDVHSDSQLVVGQYQENKIQRQTKLAKICLHRSTADDKDKDRPSNQAYKTTKMNPIHTEISWMTPIISYLQRGTLPDNRHEARRLKVRASRFLMLQGTLYKERLLPPLPSDAWHQTRLTTS